VTAAALVGLEEGAEVAGLGFIGRDFDELDGLAYAHFCGDQVCFGNAHLGMRVSRECADGHHWSDREKRQESPPAGGRAGFKSFEAIKVWFHGIVHLTSSRTPLAING
jgi:hypothetical protein